MTRKISTLAEQLANLVRPYLNIPAAGGGLYIDPPPTPNPFDDEFLDGDPDLAVRGWTIRNLTTGQVMTRVGDVVPYLQRFLGAPLGPNEYRSTLRGSRIGIQVSMATPTTEFCIYKPIAPPVGNGACGEVAGRFGSFHAMNGAAGALYHGYVHLGIWKAASGLPDLANRAMNQIVYESTDDGIVWENNYVTSGSFGQPYRRAVYSALHPQDVYGILLETTMAGANKLVFWRADSTTGTRASAAPITDVAPTAKDYAYAGIGLYSGQAVVINSHTDGIYWVDYLRFQATTGSPPLP